MVNFTFLLMLTLHSSISAFTYTYPLPILPSLRFSSPNYLHSTTLFGVSESSVGQGQAYKKNLPKLIVFDLDGCLWKPEMYELIYYSGGKGAPFSLNPSNPDQLLTVGNEPVYLLGDLRNIMCELHEYCSSNECETQVGISSRTDEPNWARELLDKFTFTSFDGEKISLSKVFQGPIEISYESKVNHFKRMSEKIGIAFEDMLFFDNEYGNCQSIAKLGELNFGNCGL